MPVVLGLMSGTSLDGLDLCGVSFTDDLRDFEILAADTIPYPQNWQQQLEQAFNADPETLQTIDVEYGFFLGQQVLNFISDHKLENLDLIASHGHTIFHKPDKGITLQIGDGKQIAKLAQIPVVYDFRQQDMDLGGQGAPLVPMGDAYLFGQYDACMNLGGVANISYTLSRQVRAFDICACNLVLNRLAQSLGKAYDNGGVMAQNGRMHKSLYNQLNKLDYYQLAPPKSLGREFVETEVWPMVHDQNTKDMLHTYTHHIAYQIGKTLNEIHAQTCLVTGGGACNTYLIDLIKSHTHSNIVLPNPQLISFKEALIFALLGWFRYKGMKNVFASVTGASKDHSSGRIATP